MTQFPVSGAAASGAPGSRSSVFRRETLAPGLYFVSTPIGAARDITLRALDVLASADVIAAEDTRTTRRLMDLHGVPLDGRQLLAYHDHNGAAQRPRLMAALAEGRSVAYASDAGTPLVADPGYRLARDAAEAGYRVHCAPGPSAMLAALTLAGLPSDRFLFVGFAPNAGGARRSFLRDLAGIEATLILFESPRRLSASLKDMADILGENRQAALCRELTKRFEEVRRGTLGALAEALATDRVKGEIVLVIGPPEDTPENVSSLDDLLRTALKSQSVKDAVSMVAQTTNIPRKDVYRRALDLAALDAGGGDEKGGQDG
jgi:16S rRNA (cytidine1402-2'-O)-methyltransferase